MGSNAFLTFSVLGWLTHMGHIPSFDVALCLLKPQPGPQQHIEWHMMYCAQARGLGVGREAMVKRHTVQLQLDWIACIR